jgi:hypothetical protein
VGAKVIGFLLAIPGRLKLWGLAIGAGAIALASIWLGGRKAGKTAAKIDKLQDEVEAHERITNANTGTGLSDDQRIKRLRDYTKRHGD